MSSPLYTPPAPHPPCTCARPDDGMYAKDCPVHRAREVTAGSPAYACPGCGDLFKHPVARCAACMRKPAIPPPPALPGAWAYPPVEAALYRKLDAAEEETRQLRERVALLDAQIKTARKAEVCRLSTPALVRVLVRRLVPWL
jgi:hypothetical protein